MESPLAPSVRFETLSFSGRFAREKLGRHGLCAIEVHGHQILVLTNKRKNPYSLTIGIFPFVRAHGIGPWTSVLSGQRSTTELCTQVELNS